MRRSIRSTCTPNYTPTGTSRQLAVGPVAMDSLLVAAGLTAMLQLTNDYISLAIVLALMMGIIQLVLGILMLIPCKLPIKTHY